MFSDLIYDVGLLLAFSLSILAAGFVAYGVLAIGLARRQPHTRARYRSPIYDHTQPYTEFNHDDN